MRKLLLLLVVIGLAACQVAVLRPLNWTTIPQYNTLSAPDLLSTAPVGIIVGDPVPFDGFLVATADWRTLVHEYERLEAALRLSQKGRGGDRESCDAYVTNLQGEVSRLKADRPRICALCAASASGLAIGVTGGVAAQACD